MAITLTHQGITINDALDALAKGDIIADMYNFCYRLVQGVLYETDDLHTDNPAWDVADSFTPGVINKPWSVYKLQEH